MSTATLPIKRATRASVTKAIVPAIFIAACAPSLVGAAHAFDQAVGNFGFRHGVIAAYTALRTAVVLAFALFVLLRGPARRPARNVAAFVFCTLAMGAIVVVGLPNPSAPTALLVTGELLILAAAAWTLGSVMTLGRCFSVLPEARGLVTTGPYRYVRHPVYLGELTMCLGIVLAAPGIRTVLAAVVFAFAQGRRMRMEEAALEAEFPEYATYAGRTRRLIPSPAAWKAAA